MGYFSFRTSCNVYVRRARKRINNLFFPTVANVGRAVLHLAAAADDEMVGEAVLHAAGAMIAIHALPAALFGR